MCFINIFYYSIYRVCIFRYLNNVSINNSRRNIIFVTRVMCVYVYSTLCKIKAIELPIKLHCFRSFVSSNIEFFFSVNCFLRNSQRYIIYVFVVSYPRRSVTFQPFRLSSNNFHNLKFKGSFLPVKQLVLALLDFLSYVPLIRETKL